MVLLRFLLRFCSCLDVFQMVFHLFLMGFCKSVNCFCGFQKVLLGVRFSAGSRMILYDHVTKTVTKQQLKNPLKKKNIYIYIYICIYIYIYIKNHERNQTKHSKQLESFRNPLKT